MDTEDVRRASPAQSFDDMVGLRPGFDDEVADRIAQMVTRSGRQRDRMAEFYRQEENRAGLKHSMRREKALDLLLSRAQTEAETPCEAPANP